MSEQALVNKILDWFHAHGAWADRINSGTQVIDIPGQRRRVFRGCKKGTSDILACWPGGLFVAVEAKMPGNKPTFEQELFLNRVREIGGLAVVAYSTDDIENAIRERINQCQTQ